MLLHIIRIRVTGKEAPFLPYQQDVDNLVPHVVEFEGWDGEAVKYAQTPADLPLPCRRYLSFLSKCIGAPIVMGTTGPDKGSYLSWLTQM